MWKTDTGYIKLTRTDANPEVWKRYWIRYFTGSRPNIPDLQELNLQMQDTVLRLVRYI